MFITFRNVVVKHLFEKRLEKGFGFDVDIGDLDVSFTGTHFRFERITVFNPKEFKKRELAYIPKLNVSCDLIDYFLRKKVHFYYVDLEIERINLIKNAKGVSNLDMMTGSWKEDLPDDLPTAIDFFYLAINDVYYIDYSENKKPAIKRFDVDIKNAFKGMDSLEDVSNVLAYQILSETKLAKVLGITLVPLSNHIKDLVLLSANVAMDTTRGIFGLPFVFK